jgi:hypothetical protein
MQELLDRFFYDKDQFPLLLILLGCMAWAFWHIDWIDDEPSHYYDPKTGEVKRR